MRTFILTCFFSFFLLLVVFGVLSISPLVNTTVTDQLIARLTAMVIPSHFPLTPLESTVHTTGFSTLTADSQSFALASPQVLGMQSNAGILSAVKIYDLINGDRRDQRLTTLQVHSELESAAAALHVQFLQQSPTDSDIFNELQKTGHAAKVFTFLHASAEDSEWHILQNWLQDSATNQKIRSNTYTEMGISIFCDVLKEEKCSVLLLLASP